MDQLPNSFLVAGRAILDIQHDRRWPVSDIQRSQWPDGRLPRAPNLGPRRNRNHVPPLPPRARFPSRRIPTQRTGSQHVDWSDSTFDTGSAFQARGSRKAIRRCDRTTRSQAGLLSHSIHNPVLSCDPGLGGLLVSIEVDRAYASRLAPHDGSANPVSASKRR